MRQFLSRLALSGSLVCLLSCLAAPVSAAEPETLPAGLTDRAFSRYVELALVREALVNGDPAQLCDAALQLAEGERVLLRSHKGLPASRIFRLALEVAIDKRDLKTIDRLDKAASLHKLETLQQMIPEARKLAGKARRLDAGSVPTDGMSVEALLLYKSFLEQIRTAASLNDKARLDRLERGLSALTDLDETHIGALRQRLNAARKNLSGKDDDGDDLLRKLTASARTTKKLDAILKKE